MNLKIDEWCETRYSVFSVKKEIEIFTRIVSRYNPPTMRCGKGEREDDDDDAAALMGPKLAQKQSSRFATATCYRQRAPALVPRAAC